MVIGVLIQFRNNRGRIVLYVSAIVFELENRQKCQAGAAWRAGGITCDVSRKNKNAG